MIRKPPAVPPVESIRFHVVVLGLTGSSREARIWRMPLSSSVSRPGGPVLLSARQARITHLAAGCLVFALIVVPILFGAAMANFPAGHRGMDRYTFGQHVMSDLGRTHIHATPNTRSFVLFMLAMGITGVTLAVFWVSRHFFLVRPAARRTALVFGLLMGACMMGIGVTPYDRVPRIHDPVTSAAAAAGVLAALAIFLDADDRLENRRVKRAWLCCFLLIGFSWAGLIVLHALRKIPLRPWLPGMQMIIIASSIVWMAYQAVRLFRVIAVHPDRAASSLSPRRERPAPGPGRREKQIGWSR